MTLTECFKAICLHYGKPSTHEGKPVRIPAEYDETIGRGVAEWLRAYAKTHDDFQPLFDKLTEQYSVSYKTLPDKPKFIAAAEALERMVPVVPRQLPEEPTDQERAQVVEGLGEIMMGLKYGKRIERSEPYRE